MTADELRTVFNNKFGLGDWPESYEVDAETYANVCQAVFNHEAGKSQVIFWDVVEDDVQKRDMRVLPISVGPKCGIMFKGIELIKMTEGNPLQKELLDLITLMPDSQTQEIIDYITQLREIRRVRDYKG